MKVARRAGEDEQIEAKLELYADQLMAWPERVALAVIDEHPRRSIYWPAWKELEDLRGEFEAAERERRPALAAPGTVETFSARVDRLAISGRRLAAIGVQRWKVLMDRHRDISDQELLAAFDRLEAGKSALLRASDDWEPFKTKREWDDFQACLTSLRDPNTPHAAREPLLKIGEQMEVRQLENARAMGWVA